MALSLNPRAFVGFDDIEVRIAVNRNFERLNLVFSDTL